MINWHSFEYSGDGPYFVVIKRKLVDDMSPKAYLVLSKWTPFVTGSENEPPCCITEPGPVWFEYDDDTDAAMAKLAREMAH